MCALVLITAPLSAGAAGDVVTAMIAKSASVGAGEDASFEIGLTSNDGALWPAASVVVAVDVLAADGSTIASGRVQSVEDVAPNRTTFAFVNVKLPALATGVYEARGVVLHGGGLAGISDLIGIAVGTLVAQPAAPAQSAGLRGQLASNEIFGAHGTQSGSFALTGKYGGDRNFQADLGISTAPGAQRPVATIQTLGSVTQIGTFAPSFDPLVFSGASGTGINFKRVWRNGRSISLANVSGAHATANPFTLDALSYSVPGRAGSIAFTIGDERIEGPVPFGAATFMRSGTLAGVVFDHPADARGMSFALRYGVVNYLDEVAGVRRTDRALEGLLGFKIARSAWTLDLVRAGPYFPNLSAPGVTPDRETDSLQGTIPVGNVVLTLGVNAARDALPGSQSTQQTHSLSENIGLAIPLRNRDALSFNLSNATQHRNALESLAGANDSTSISYSARRGSTDYVFAIASSNQRDNFGNLQHTTQDSITVGRSFGALRIGTGANFTGNYAADAGRTALLQAFNGSATWTRGSFNLTTQLNRSTSLPFLGQAPVPQTSLNYGLSFKPFKTGPSLSASMTQNHSTVSSSTGSLNLSRQF
ncbi:MAG: hypothetical protein NVSMB64_10020 [Candidatus Velthaea sp.]